MWAHALSIFKNPMEIKKKNKNKKTNNNNKETRPLLLTSFLIVNGKNEFLNISQNASFVWYQLLTYYAKIKDFAIFF